MAQKYFFRKFHKKSFRIRCNTILEAQRAKYEGLTPPELREINLNQLSLAFYLLTLGNVGFPIVFLNKIDDLGKKPDFLLSQYLAPSSGGVRPSYLVRLVFSIVLPRILKGF